MRVRVEIEGVEEIARAARRLAAEISGPVTAQAALAAAEVVRAAAQAKAPRRTGSLARSIVAEPLRQVPGRARVAVGPDRAHFYGLFVELGHALVRGRRKAEKRVLRHVPPHPFLRPALDESRDRAARAAADVLRAALERGGRG